MNFFDVVCSRRSIRKFQDVPVPQEDIEKMLRAAMSAPSACGCQNWHLVVLQSREAIQGLANAVEKGVKRVMHELELEDETFLSNRIKQETFFVHAPVVFAVYMEPMIYHDRRITEKLVEYGMDAEERSRFFGQPDLLTIGAAIENLLLCAHDLGYGGCWMNDPVIAAQEIDEYLGQSAPRRLISIVPVGVPAYTPREKTLRNDTVEYR